MAGPSDGGGLPWASILDPIANARSLGDIQARALRAASEIVDRLVQSVDGVTARQTPDGAATASAAGAGDATRLVEFWIAFLQQASASFAAAGASDGRPKQRVEVDLGATTSPGLLRLDVDESGAIRTDNAEAWLHNGTAASFGPLTLHTGELRSPDDELLAATVTCDPAHVDALPARSSRGVALSIMKDGDLRPGVYRGVLQVQGAPAVWLPIEVVVRDNAAPL